jgi:hypothetical protein
MVTVTTKGLVPMQINPEVYDKISVPAKKALASVLYRG